MMRDAAETRVVFRVKGCAERASSRLRHSHGQLTTDNTETAAWVKEKGPLKSGVLSSVVLSLQPPFYCGTGARTQMLRPDKNIPCSTVSYWLAPHKTIAFSNNFVCLLPAKRHHPKWQWCRAQAIASTIHLQRRASLEDRAKYTRANAKKVLRVINPTILWLSKWQWPLSVGYGKRLVFKEVGPLFQALKKSWWVEKCPPNKACRLLLLLSGALAGSGKLLLSPVVGYFAPFIHSIYMTSLITMMLRGEPPDPSFVPIRERLTACRAKNKALLLEDASHLLHIEERWLLFYRGETEKDFTAFACC